ncbi:MAG: peptide chain release factor N(5)-glutamine methyltransferase [Candidatus Saccharibacteria bacterium]
MNENLQPPVPTINTWIADATAQLKDAQIDSARLDGELLLAHTLKKPRTYLHAHGDDPLTLRMQEIADSRLLLRLDRVPLAYIIGHKEFFGRNFKVTPATLIPRPESEDIIHILKEQMPKSVALLPSGKRLIDVGTGSGCLGITAKLELPELDVTLLDISTHALNVAEENAQALHANITTIRSDLLQSYPFTPAFILANLPYVDPDWELSPELQHEPALALFAAENGLSLIRKLIEQSSELLQQTGILLLEADARQHDAIITIAKSHGFRLVETRGLILHFEHYG